MYLCVRYNAAPTVEAFIVHLRVNFKHEVLLLLEVCDGVENITHGEDSAAVRSPVLHVRRPFL